MGDVDIAVSSLEETINEWPSLFEDLNEGGDTVRWQKLVVKELAPAALSGQDWGKGISVGGVFNSGERSLLSFPAFIDDDPEQSEQPTPPSVKIKFNGKKRQGLVVVTDASIKTAEYHGGRVIALSMVRSDVTHVGEVNIKFSTMSMTSAGPAYEILFDEGGTKGRVLFRVALDPRGDGFTDKLRNLILSE